MAGGIDPSGPSLGQVAETSQVRSSAHLALYIFFVGFVSFLPPFWRRLLGVIGFLSFDRAQGWAEIV